MLIDSGEELEKIFLSRRDPGEIYGRQNYPHTPAEIGHKIKKYSNNP